MRSESKLLQSQLTVPIVVRGMLSVEEKLAIADGGWVGQSPVPLILASIETLEIGELRQLIVHTEYVTVITIRVGH